jgi:hypothetical protein
MKGMGKHGWVTVTSPGFYLDPANLVDPVNPVQ